MDVVFFSSLASQNNVCLNLLDFNTSSDRRKLTAVPQKNLYKFLDIDSQS
jgi:hypothetical protein